MHKPDHGVVRFELNPSPVRTGSSILKGTVPVRFGAVRCDADPVRFGAGSVPPLWRRPKAASTLKIVKSTLKVVKYMLKVAKSTLKVAKPTLKVAKSTLKVAKYTLKVAKSTLKVAEYTSKSFLHGCVGRAESGHPTKHPTTRLTRSWGPTAGRWRHSSTRLQK